MDEMDKMEERLRAYANLIGEAPGLVLGGGSGDYDDVDDGPRDGETSNEYGARIHRNIAAQYAISHLEQREEPVESSSGLQWSNSYGYFIGVDKAKGPSILEAMEKARKELQPMADRLKQIQAQIAAMLDLYCTPRIFIPKSSLVVKEIDQKIGRIVFVHGSELPRLTATLRGDRYDNYTIDEVKTLPPGEPPMATATTPVTFSAETMEASRSDEYALLPRVPRSKVNPGDLFFYIDSDGQVDDGHEFEARPGNIDWSESFDETDCGIHGDGDTSGLVVVTQTYQERLAGLQAAVERLRNLANPLSGFEARADRTSPIVSWVGDELELRDQDTGSQMSSEDWSYRVSAALRSKETVAKTLDRNLVTLQGNWPGADDPE